MLFVSVTNMIRMRDVSNQLTEIGRGGRVRFGGDIESVDVGCALYFLYTPQFKSVST